MQRVPNLGRLHCSQSRCVDIHQVRLDEFTFQLEHVGERDRQMAAIMSSIADATLANRRIGKMPGSVYLMPDTGNILEKGPDRRLNGGSTGYRRTVREPENGVFCEELAKTVDIHGMYGREQAGDGFVIHQSSNPYEVVVRCRLCAA